ncbi:hypothetical protein CRG98_021219 [Punica granatum]|uniref:Uncharacterized protein n=1 Tax=Punica granatum TaxID=22663 RepID=A0A2I0JQ76_PUNGR|nr:hypothetical protein CRG98_021219 [Punica granatum]
MQRGLMRAGVQVRPNQLVLGGLKGSRDSPGIGRAPRDLDGPSRANEARPKVVESPLGPHGPTTVLVTRIHAKFVLNALKE